MKSSPIAAAYGTTIGLRISFLYRRAVRGPSRMIYRIIPTAMVPPDENTPIIRMNRKTVLQKNIAPFIYPPVHDLLLTPCSRDDALMLV
ncbi:hypothetical protein TNCV_1268011 [Trichonephila clavipes]|nr:hypothetical protein TNCV_1268011 [Trichonephila clavipes]